MYVRFAIISKANWMTYLTMTSSTVQLFVLTVALIIYTFRDRRKKSKNDNSEDKELMVQNRILETVQTNATQIATK